MRFLTVLYTFIIFATSSMPVSFADDNPAPPDYNKGAQDIVYFIPQFSDFTEVNEQDRLFLKKTLKKAAEENAKAVIFEIDTPGGRIDVALKYLTILGKSEVPTIAYMHKGISAGAIIALGADRIVINPDGMIGDAMPIQMGPTGIKPIVDKPDDLEKEDTKENSKDDVSKNDKKEDSAKETEESDNKVEPTTLEKILKEIEKLKGKQDKKQEQSPEQKKLADQKFLTVFFKTLQVLAEKNDRPVRVVRAMADPYQKLTIEKDGYEHSKISPLTLSAKEAKKLKVVDYICRTKRDMYDVLDLSDCTIVIAEKSGTEQIIYFLAHPVVSGFLIMIGILGVYIEVRTPGFGVPGIMGLTALTLFFFGHIGVGDSGWGPAVVFFVGVVLMMIEVFVIPSFGIIGILGAISMLISLFWAFGIENVENATYVIGTSLLGAVIAILLLTLYILPKSSMFKRLTLSATTETTKGYTSHAKRDSHLVGKIGVAKTDLRPSGTMVIDDKKYDVLTDGEYVIKGDQVRVTGTKGIQILVEKV